MEKITSRDNARIKYACKLAASGAFRRSEGRFFAEGRKLCPELARAAQLETLFLTAAAAEKCPRLAALPGEHFLVEDHVAAKLAGVPAPQGVFGVFRTPAHTLEEVRPGGRYLALEGVQDPGNVGTLLRSAAAFGFDGVILSEGCAAPYAPKTLRASMGAAVQLPVIEAGAMPPVIGELRRKGIECLAAALYRSQPLGDAKAGPGGVCVVIGSEGQGLTEATIAACDRTVRIPMTGRVESLNAGIAGSILLWHFPGGRAVTAGLWTQQSLFGQQEPPEALLCWLWLAHTLGPASAHAGRLLAWCGGDARLAWNERETPAFREAAGPAAARRAVQPDNTPEAFRPLARRCQALGVQVIPFDHPDYPLALTRIPDMPLVLYCTGDPAWLNAPGLIGMVGSRRPDPYGCQMAAGLGRDLARGGAVIVSGLAEGLDSVCHRAALEGAGPTIGVQGVPIDRTYPASNRWLREEIEASGCVVGEYPPGDNLAGRNGFLQRNRLIAGLARALVVVQARERSGTMSTVAHAERYGRKIFALPGDIGRENAAGTNRLIQSGRARMALSAEEILEELSLRAAPVPDRQEPPLTETQRKVLACAGSEPKSLEELAAACGMQAAALAAVLMGLELAGRIKALPGQRYILL